MTPALEPPGGRAPRLEARDAFATYLARTDEKAVTLAAAVSDLQRLRPALWRRLCDPGQDVSILAVGAGRGDLEIPLVQRIIAARGGRAGGVHLYCEDASPEMRADFLAAAAAAGIAECVEAYSTERVEAYAPPPGVAVDLAIASHVLYYVAEWDPVLAMLRDATSARGGAVLLSAGSLHSDPVVLRAEYQRTAQGRDFHGSAEQIADWLAQRGIPAQVSETVARVDVRDLFTGDHFRPGPDGERLLAFILRARWADISPPVQRRLGALIRQMSAGDEGRVLHARATLIWVPPAVSGTGSAA